MARAVASVCLVGRYRRGNRLAALVVEPALGDVAAETDAENAATDAQCNHDADDGVPVPVHHPTPPGEHLSS